MQKAKPDSKVRLSEFDSKLGLDRGASKLKEVCWYLIKMFFFLSAFPFPSSFKSFLLRSFGATIGQNVIIKPRVNIHFPWKLSVGNNTWIGEEALLLNFEQLTIGSNVCISQRSFLCGGNHDFKTPIMNYRNRPIVLEDGCWIGASCFIGPGVQIGVDSVIVAGSVVTTSVSANLVCRINPTSFEKQRWSEPTDQ